jgi:hypothetical protein
MFTITTTKWFDKKNWTLFSIHKHERCSMIQRQGCLLGSKPSKLSPTPKVFSGSTAIWKIFQKCSSNFVIRMKIVKEIKLTLDHQGRSWKHKPREKSSINYSGNPTKQVIKGELLSFWPWVNQSLIEWYGNTVHWSCCGRIETRKIDSAKT